MKRLLMIMNLITVFIGCDKSESTIDPVKGEAISFSQELTADFSTRSLEDAPSTKGSVLAAPAGIEVLALKSSDNSEYIGWKSLKETSEGSNKWGYDPIELYPLDGSSLDFYSYSPKGTGNTGNGIAVTSVNQLPQITYTVPTTIADQTDLLVTQPQKNKNINSGEVALGFKHALAKVSFSVKGVNTRKINSITIKNIQYIGTLSFQDAEPFFAWSNSSAERSLTLSTANGAIEEVIPAADGTSVTPVTTTTGHLFMLPQNVAGKEIELSITDAFGYNEVTETVNLAAGSEWTSGVPINYIITLEQNTVTITESTIHGNTNSTNEDINGEIRPLPPVVPDVTQYFHTLFPNVSNSYIVTKDAGEVTIPISEYISYFWTSYGADEREKYWATLPAHQLEAEVIWSEQNTAITGFPLVIPIFTETGTANKTTLNAPLSDYTASTSAMVMKFTINSVHTNNNFTIGVRRKDAPAGEYLWSWHIWVTDYNPYAAEGQKTVTYGGVTNVWMDRHLGAYVNTYTANGNGILFYQWGRKDPLPSAKTTAVSAASHIAAVIKAPDKFYTSTTGTDSDFCGTSTDWDQDRDHHWRDKKLASINSSPKYDTRKSIFDPSPLGWMVPVPSPSATAHTNTTSPFAFMNSSYWGNYGRTGSGVFFPASGYRDDATGVLSDYSSRGYSWSASASSSGNAHSFALNASSQGKYPSNSYLKSHGFSVRAIREKI